MTLSPEAEAEAQRWHHMARVLAQHGHRRAAMPLAVQTTAAATALYSGQCVLLGWSLADTSGAANPVAIRQGVDATSQTVAVVDLAASSSQTQWFGPNGVLCQGGVFVAPTGTLTGSVFVLPLNL